MYSKPSLAVIFGEFLHKQGAVPLFPHRHGKHLAHTFEKTELNVRLVHQATEFREHNRGFGTRNGKSDTVRGSIQVRTEKDILVRVANDHST